jgi:hypothetical protein
MLTVAANSAFNYRRTYAVRIALICLLSTVAATCAGVALLFISYVFFMNQKVSAEDLAGVAMFCFVPSLLMSALLYTPGLHWLSKKRRECGPPMLFVAVCAGLLNIPAFAVLGYSAASGGFFGEGEAWYFAAAYFVGGTLYGVVYAWHCRRRAL